MDRLYAEQLLERWHSGTASLEEQALVRQWLMFGEFPEPALSDRELSAELARIDARLPLLAARSKVVRLWKRIAVAASVLLVVGLGVYTYRSVTSDGLGVAGTVAYDVSPGGNMAFLTLGNGRRIEVSDALKGELAQENGVRISKATDGSLVYKVSADASDKVTINTLQTPRGGTFQVQLPDGSKVWLNAASSISYPSNFAGSADRSVTLTGEAYFEVAKDKAHPFVVRSGGQTVEVLGTHFNISAYGDEPVVTTTLLEGSVKVGAGGEMALLAPGEQASFSGDKLRVVAVEAENEIAWKNGEFVFADEPLEGIMRKISRWYDVEVEYRDIDRTKLFYGTISRYENVSKVLRKLELTGGVRFELRGRRIMVAR